MGLDDEIDAIERLLAPMSAQSLRLGEVAADDPRSRLLLRRRYASGEVIFHQGDPADRIHLVEQGCVRITIASVDGREGTLAVLGPGSVFGEAALVDGGHRSAGAVAMGSATTATLDRAGLQVLALEMPGLRDAVLDGMARWMHQLTDQVAELHFLNLRGRLAATLVRLARSSGSSGGQVVLPPLTQAELASLVASTRQRVNTALRELVEDGAIALDGRRIVVCDVDALARRVHW